MTEFLSAYIPSILQLLLFMVMLGMGMTLTIKDFTRVSTKPKATFIGLVNQMLFVPLIALALVMLLPLDPMIAMGLMVCACCPGGAVSNLFSFLAKGDVALSITLTAITSILTIFTIPLIINFSLETILGEASKSIQLPFGKTIINIFKLTALPTILGMLINYKWPIFSQNSKPAIKWISITVIVLALTLMTMKLEEIGNSWQFFKASFIGVILLNTITLYVGYFSSRIFNISKKQAATISIETGMQNNVLGMTIAISTNLLNEPKMAATAGVYGIVMCVIAIGVIQLYKRIIPSKA